MSNKITCAMLLIIAIMLTVSMSIADKTYEVSNLTDLMDIVNSAKESTTIFLTEDIAPAREISLLNASKKVVITVNGNGYKLPKTRLKQGVFILDNVTVSELTLDGNGKGLTCTLGEATVVNNMFFEYGSTGKMKLTNNGTISPYGIKIYGSKSDIEIENNGLIEGADRGLEIDDTLYKAFSYTQIACGKRTVVNNGEIRSPLSIGVFVIEWRKGSTVNIKGNGTISGGWIGVLVAGANSGSVTIDNHIISTGTRVSEDAEGFGDLETIIHTGIQESKANGVDIPITGKEGTAEWVISGIQFCVNMGEGATYETIDYQDVAGFGVAVLIPDVLKKLGTKITVKQIPEGKVGSFFTNHQDRLNKKVTIAK